MRPDGSLLLVATTGGHLSQLRELADRFPNFPRRLWVTFDDAQGRSLLAGERVIFIPEIKERDVAGVYWDVPRPAPSWRRRSRPSAAVDEHRLGDRAAVPIVPAMRGIPAHLIEIAARTGKPSLTGRFSQPYRGFGYQHTEHCAAGRWGSAVLCSTVSAASTSARDRSSGRGNPRYDLPFPTAGESSGHVNPAGGGRSAVADGNTPTQGRPHRATLRAGTGTCARRCPPPMW